LAVVGGFALVLYLRCHGRRARTAEGRYLGWLRTDGDAAAPSVIGDAGRVVDDDGAVVDVGDVDVDAVDGAVVVEVVSVPVAAVIAETGVTEAVVDASVETDVEAPVATVEAPAVVVPTPVAGSPECSIVGGSAPCAGDPVVAGGGPVPVAGSPDVVRSGGYGLIVFRERRRGLVSVLNGCWLAFLVKLVKGLGVLVVLVLIGGWRRCLNRSGLFWILLCGLLRSSLIMCGKNLSPWCGCRGDGWSRWELGVVCRCHVGISGIGAGVVGCGGVGIDPVAACRADECCDT
jgi:hypothetical protein